MPDMPDILDTPDTVDDMVWVRWSLCIGETGEVELVIVWERPGGGAEPKMLEKAASR